MKKRNGLWSGIVSVICMCVLILDSRTALIGAEEGILLCINSVVPALFPFFVLSTVFNANITGRKIPFLSPLTAACGIPQGCESILLLGLLGGYPVGAQAVYDAYQNKTIRSETAARLLGFCSNAGPSFIFGIIATQFSAKITAWFVWLIHLISALLVGVLLPGKAKQESACIQRQTVSLPKAMEKALKALSTVCGWVVLFRVIIAICQRWFLWLLRPEHSAAISGFLELTNGCCILNTITSESFRFVLACCLLSFGGICVLLQTLSITKQLGLGMYLPGKILQTLLSFTLAAFVQPLLFNSEEPILLYYPLTGALLIILFVVILHRKKSSSIIKKCVV